MKNRFFPVDGSGFFAAWLVLVGVLFAASDSSLLAMTEGVENVFTEIESIAGKTPYPRLKGYLQEKGIQIQPYFKTRMDYTSNVFGAPDAKDDVIWVFTPGIRGAANLFYTTLTFGYEADFNYFTKFSKQNEQDQSFFVSGILNPTPDSYLQVNEQFVQKGVTAGDALFEPVDYADNTVNVTGGYVWKDWTAQMAYENYDREFQAQVAKQFSYNENRFDWRLYRKVTDTSRFHSGFKLGILDFEKFHSRDTSWYEFPIGGNAKFWGVDAEGSVGIHRRNLHAEGREDLTYVVGSLSLRKKLREKTTVDLSFLRRPVESSFENQTVYDEKLLSAGLTHLCTSKLRGKASISWANRDFEESSFTGQRFIVGGATFISQAGVLERSDHVFAYDAGFDYIVRRWLIVNMGYRYSRRDSNVASFDATEHRLSLGSTIIL